MATPESKVKAKVRAILKKYRAYYFTPVGGGYGTSGVPDIVACYCGLFIGIECKAGSNKPTDLQKHNLSLIRVNGGAGLVVNEENVNDVERLLAGLKGEADGTAG